MVRFKVTRDVPGHREGEVVDVHPRNIGIWKARDWAVPAGEPEPERAVEEPAEKRAQAVHTGGGWYEITVDGERVDKVQGKAAAEKAVADLGGA